MTTPTSRPVSMIFHNYNPTSAFTLALTGRSAHTLTFKWLVFCQIGIVIFSFYFDGSFIWGNNGEETRSNEWVMRFRADGYADMRGLDTA